MESALEEYAERLHVAFDEARKGVTEKSFINTIKDAEEAFWNVFWGNN